jgi:penicillin-binding protein-related factor A (putative recombinase)
MAQDHSSLGSRANLAGRTFERSIVDACDYYREEAVADIQKCSPASRTLPHSVRLAGISEVDFDGDLISGPYKDKRIAFDAKSISKNSTYSHSTRDRHQIAYLMRLQSKGHIGFILLYDHRLDMMWLFMDVRRILHAPEWVDVRTVRDGRVESFLPQVVRRDGVWDFLPVAFAEYDRLFGGRV